MKPVSFLNALKIVWRVSLFNRTDGVIKLASLNVSSVRIFSAVYNGTLLHHDCLKKSVIGLHNICILF